MATVNLGRIKFVWQGAYSGATAYVADDVVSYNGSSYICILASTNNLPTNTTYWNQMSSAGTNGTNGTDVGTTITTQGDLLYRDASGLQRLGAGTSGQFLKTNGSGANPAWATVATGANAGEVIQVLSATDSTQRSTTSSSFVTASNTLSVTITPASASNKILILTNVVGRGDVGVGNIYLTIYRGGTNLGNGTNGFATDYNGEITIMSGAYLDSPSSTSALTYQVYFRVTGGTANITQGSTNTITVLEVKG